MPPRPPSSSNFTNTYATVANADDSRHDRRAATPSIILIGARSHADGRATPLASTFMLSTKAGKEAYVETVIEGGGYRFAVKVWMPKNGGRAKRGTKLARGANFKCLMSGAPISGDYIKAEGKAGRIGSRLMAIVAEGDRNRVYLPPTKEMESITLQAKPTWKPETPLAPEPRALWTPPYGLVTYGDLFTPRQ